MMNKKKEQSHNFWLHFAVTHAEISTHRETDRQTQTNNTQNPIRDIKPLCSALDLNFKTKLS